LPRVRERIPEATVRRIPLYLQTLEALPASWRQISSEEMAVRAGVKAATLRKDLSFLGCLGIRGVGYAVEDLQARIRAELGLTREWSMVIVGVGNLGRALASFEGFEAQGFHVVGLFDVDAVKVGTEVAGLTVEPVGDLIGSARGRNADIGVITTPAAAAQQVADLLAKAGVRSILNFSPSVIRVPEPIDVRRVDFSNELRVISYHLHRRGSTEETA
jgi:redox-sensing transcriptional repressor